jgi:hypothetical protein
VKDGTTLQAPPRTSTEAELARWDGATLQLNGALILQDPPGPVELYIALYSAPPGRPAPMDLDEHRERMARIPRLDEIRELIRTAEAAWQPTQRRQLLLRVRFLDELEARRAWGAR